MSNLNLALKTGCFLFLLFFGAHYIRSWAFNRYEAVTFECSSGAFLISVLLIVRNGLSYWLSIMMVALLFMFFANAFVQHHFYKKLQEKIRMTLKGRIGPRKIENTIGIINLLYSIASAAIMPSFSRFIEEQNAFNNPGSLIGLIKSIMKRQRFQKKKYLMRECFSENLNLIGPCKATLRNGSVKDASVFQTVHAEDLALKCEDEKKGLLAFDLLGFGAMAAIWCFLVVFPNQSCCEGIGMPTKSASILFLILPVFTVFSCFLRLCAFARHESLGYELSFSALVAASFYTFEELISCGHLSVRTLWTAGFVWLLFLAASIINHQAEKAFHKKINGAFDDIIDSIPPYSETNRTKRTFLRNLKTISEWAIVPFPDEGAKSKHQGQKTEMLIEKVLKFIGLSQDRNNMLKSIWTLIKSILPERRLDEHMIIKFSPREQWITEITQITGLIGITGIIAVCLWVEMI